MGFEHDVHLLRGELRDIGFTLHHAADARGRCCLGVVGGRYAESSFNIPLQSVNCFPNTKHNIFGNPKFRGKNRGQFRPHSIEVSGHVILEGTESCFLHSCTFEGK